MNVERSRGNKMNEFINKYKKNFLFVILIGVGIYIFIFFRNDVREVTSQIQDINLKYLITVILLLVLYILLEGLVIYVLARISLKGISLFDSFRLNLSTQFFNAITPFSSGGQPFQVLYLGSRGIKAKDSTSIVIMNYITYNIAFIIVSVLCLIFRFRYFNDLLREDGYKYVLLMGFGINLAVTILTFFLAFSKKIYHILVESVWVKMIHWPILRRIKLENKTDKIKIWIEDFNQEIKNLNKHKLLWVECIAYHGLRIVIFHMIPLLIFLALGENISNMEINLFVGAFFVSMVMAYIPTPGASGGAEGIFYLIFIHFFEMTVIPALLLWRFTTYYLYLLLGFFALITLNYKKNLKEINYPK